MKSMLPAAGLALLGLAAAGRPAEPWKIDANANLTTALNSYSNSWVGGEAGSFTWASQFLGVAERQMNRALNSKTTLKLQFGQTKVQDKTTKAWGKRQKSSDLIDAEELVRLTLGVWLDPFASVRGISQFQDASDTLLTRYLNPWDITEAAGVSRTLKKSDLIDWSTRLGGAVRQSINRDKLDTATRARATDFTNDGGVEFNMDLKVANAGKWFTLLSALKVYEALLSSKEDTANVWRYPHVKLENTLTLTVAKYLMLNISAYLYYDKDIDDGLRLKETISAGLTYTFKR